MCKKTEQQVIAVATKKFIERGGEVKVIDFGKKAYKEAEIKKLMAA